MRLERPIGWWLLALPCWWSLALGQIALGGGLPSLWYAALFLIGAIIMRSGRLHAETTSPTGTSTGGWSGPG